MPPAHPSSLRKGRFSLIHSLGSGGMASVYRAYDHELRVWRAIKLLAPEYSRRSQIRTRFGAEAQTMAALEHPNVIRVYDVGVEDDVPYIVMELAEGGCVSDWIDEHGAMPLRMALDVVLQLCRGIHEAHSRGVVHRDVKPHNLLVDAAGRVMVTDFGIAQAGRDGEASLTRTGTVMGTLGFMAPEQRADAKNVDVRADVYAIGATLFMLLTGRISMELFVADTNPEVLEDVPPEMVAIVVKACAYKPAARYQRVLDLASDLMAIREDCPPIPADTPPLVRVLPSAEPPRRTGGGPTQAPRIAPAPKRAAPRRTGTSTYMEAPLGSAPTRLRSATEVEEAAMDRLTTARTRMDRSDGEKTMLAPAEWLDPDAKAITKRVERPVGPLTDVDVEPAAGASVLVHMECGPKRRHGMGNPLNGCMAIQAMLDVREFTDVMSAEAERRGLHPARVQALYDDGSGPRVLSMYDADQRTEDLDKYDADCANCPARVRQSSYGCFVHLSYPIAAKSEAWLMGRLRSGGTLGSDFCTQMLGSRGFTGRAMAPYRRDGLFESSRPISQVVKEGWIFNTSVDSNQVFEALLLGGSDFLEPTNCLGMALWFGAIQIDGITPEDLTDADLRRLAGARTPDARRERTRLRLGERSSDPAVVAMQQILKALYLAWVTDARILAEP
ncbi:MAG: tRNA A-37 threonylcarbamoyl transferase component Bud32 [Myxococcota bacterium]|jgi:tRNA A-37 threonylcarbamoyl transferase component Bud32